MQNFRKNNIYIYICKEKRDGIPESNKTDKTLVENRWTERGKERNEKKRETERQREEIANFFFAKPLERKEEMRCKNHDEHVPVLVLATTTTTTSLNGSSQIAAACKSSRSLV
jgi:hypothetical protein